MGFKVRRTVVLGVNRELFSDAMLSYLKLGLFASAAAGESVDVRGAFKSYCHDFCGSGGYANCDIGSGKLAMGQSDAAPSVETEFVESGIGAGPIPALDAERNTSAVAACNEKTGNTCQHTSGWAWCNYEKYKCMTHYSTAGEAKYSNIKSEHEPGATGFVFTHWVDNNSPVTQTSTVAFDESTMAEADLTLSSTVTAGVEISLTEKVPEVLEDTFKESFSVSTSSSSTRKQSKTQHWSITQPVTVPKKTTMKVEMIITKVKVTGDWSAQVKFPEYAKVWCNNKKNGHYEWFVPGQNFLPKHSSLCHGDVCTIKGKFEGWHGISSQVKLTQCKLGSRHCEKGENDVVVV